MFDVLAMSLVVLERLAPIEPKILAKRKSLAVFLQHLLPIERSSESVPLNVAEGEKRRGSIAHSGGAPPVRRASSPSR